MGQTVYPASKKLQVCSQQLMSQVLWHLRSRGTATKSSTVIVGHREFKVSLRYTRPCIKTKTKQKPKRKIGLTPEFRKSEGMWGLRRGEKANNKREGTGGDEMVNSTTHQRTASKTVNYHPMSTQWLKTTLNVGEDMKQEPSLHCWMGCKMIQSLWKTV